MLLAAAQDYPSVCRLLLEYRSNITDTLTLIAADDSNIPSNLGNIHFGQLEKFDFPSVILFLKV